MKISEVIIEKFRSIKKSSFIMRDITAVVGENNAGKTAVLRALNAVLNYKYEEKSFLNKAHKYAARSNTYITIVFEDVPAKSIYQDKLYENKLTIKFSFRYGENKKKYTLLKGRNSENLDDSFMDKLSEDIMYVYIPTGRTNKDVRWSSDSIFKDLITNYIAQYTENRDRISGHVRKATRKIHDTVLKKLEKKINELYMQDKNVDFKIDFPETLDYNVLLKNIEFSLNEYGENHLLQEWGSGTKSLAVIAMHRANALLKDGSIILGIEEPEINLHPQAQKRFIMSLRQQLQTNEIQSIFTTHSTVLVDELKHEEILLLRRVHDSSRGFISQINQLPKDFWKKNREINQFKHYQYFNYKNSEFFFSKYVVIAESKNDCQVLEELVREELKTKIADISFLDAGGVKNIQYPFFLLKELDIPFSIVVDKDFFFPYSDNELELSRNIITGLPKYRNTVNTNKILDCLFDEAGKAKLIKQNKQGYRKFFDFIKGYNIVSMNYCLEMDLTCSAKAREEYYKMLEVAHNDKNQKALLTQYKKKIKDIGTIMEVIKRIPSGAYPESYKKIKNYLIERINENID